MHKRAVSVTASFNFLGAQWTVTNFVRLRRSSTSSPKNISEKPMNFKMFSEKAGSRRAFSIYKNTKAVSSLASYHLNFNDGLFAAERDQLFPIVISSHSNY